MHDAGAMSDTKCARHLRHDLERLIGRHRPARDPFAEGEAFDEFNRDVMRGIDLPDLVHGHDVGMVQGRGGARLEFQPLESCFVRDEGARQQLQADFAAESFVVCKVDHAHPPDAEDRVDPVAAKMLTDERIRIIREEFGRGRRERARQ